jgi:hypothetical protein
MAKVRIIGLDIATKKQKRKILKLVQQSNFKDELRNDLINETRDAGVEPQLKDSSVKHRRYLAKNNKTHEKYQAEKSNLTLTGKFLDSMKSFFILSKGQFVFEFPKKKHPPYLKNNGKPIKGKRASMSDIYQYQAEKGRDIAQAFEREEFLRKISKKLVDAIKKLLRD